MPRILQLELQVAWGLLAAFTLEADILALLRKGALRALGGQLDFACDVLTLREERADPSLAGYQVGRNVLSVVAFGERPPRSVRGPKLTASHFGRVFAGTRPDLSTGCLHLPLTADAL